MITRNTRSKNQGFTLIELLVVIAIIGVLSSVVLASLNSARMKARDTKRIADLRQIQTALELYYDANGYYPRVTCGWDCNGYSHSYDNSWDSLASNLAPYISSLPKDPLNSGNCPPWNTNCFTYAYGNVGRNTQRVQYDLTAQLEDSNSKYRCAVKQWKFYFDNQNWCPPYSSQVYEASNN